MEIPKDTLKQISEKLNTTILTRRVSEIYYNNHREDIVPYNNYTIIEYLQLYKANRMLELGVISEKEYNYLIELFAIRKYLNNKLVSELIRESSSDNIYIYEGERYVSKTKLTLTSNIRNIDEILERYHLDFTPLALEELIDIVIKGEGHNFTPLEELESVTQKVKSLKENI